MPQPAPRGVCKQRQRHQLLHRPRPGANMRPDSASGVREARRGPPRPPRQRKERGPPSPTPLGARSTLRSGGAADAMSVPGLMYVYGGALVGAGFLGLDKGVPVAGPAPLVPLATGLGATMLLLGYLSTPSGPQPPKKGEPGFGLCVRYQLSPMCLLVELAQRRYMAAVHMGLLMPLAFTGARRSVLAHTNASPHTLSACRRVCVPSIHRPRVHTQRRVAAGACGALMPQRVAWRVLLQPTFADAAVRAAWERGHVPMACRAQAQKEGRLMRERLADTA